MDGKMLQLAHSHALSRGFVTVGERLVECSACHTRLDPMDKRQIDGHYYQHRFEEASKTKTPFMYLVVKGNTVTLVTYGQGSFDYTFPNREATFNHVLAADRAIRDDKTLQEVKKALEQPL